MIIDPLIKLYGYHEMSLYPITIINLPSKYKCGERGEEYTKVIYTFVHKYYDGSNEEYDNEHSANRGWMHVCKCIYDSYLKGIKLQLLFIIPIVIAVVCPGIELHY